MSDVYALEVQTLFRGVPIACKQVAQGRARRRRALFVIGSAPRADAPVAPAYVDLGADTAVAAAVTAHPLVTAAEEDGHYDVNLTPRMAGAIARADDASAVAALAHLPPSAHGALTLRPGDRARVECGAVTFLLASAPRAAAIGAPAFPWRSTEMRHHLSTALAASVALWVLMSVPADPRALALDWLQRDHAWAKLQIKPPVAPPAADPLAAAPTPLPAGGGAGAAARGTAGAAGSPSGPAQRRQAAARGATPIRDIPRTSPNPAQISRMSVLAFLSKTEAARSIFTRESAFGDHAADVLGSLVAAPVGDVFGEGGLGRLGTGAANAGEGDHTIGEGHLQTVGWIGPGDGGGPGGPGSGRPYGRLAGTLGPRTRPITPEFIPGIPVVNGSLDREIIRRIIRRHLNEVKFCYEQELSSHPALGGRLLVRFMIAPTGQVLTSVLESSTLGNARVESCTTQAVRRWEFPRPLNGGMVTVSYPFVMTPAASGN